MKGPEVQFSHIQKSTRSQNTRERLPGFQDRPNNRKGVTETSGTPEPTQKVRPEGVVVPQDLILEAVSQGLAFPVDVTFDDEGSIYIAEAGDQTYGTKPEKAPSARIMWLAEAGTWEVVYTRWYQWM